MQKFHLVCLVGILAILAAPAVFAAGTPNLGSPAVLGQGSAFGVDVRAFDATEDQDTLDNAVWGLGLTSAVNPKVDFGLWFSNIDVVDETMDDYYLDTLTIQRKVLAPSLKWLLSSPEAKAQTALTVGADVVLDGNTVTLNEINLDQGSTEMLTYQNFIPAIRLQTMWGKPGKFQYQLAAQANFFKNYGSYESQNTELAQYYYDADAPGTVLGLGGGIIWPLSSRLSVVGDFMGIVEGHNSHCTICGEAHRQANIWSAGLTYGCSNGSDLSVYATNALAANLVDSLMASPGEITAVAASWGTSW